MVHRHGGNTPEECGARCLRSMSIASGCTHLRTFCRRSIRRVISRSLVQRCAIDAMNSSWRSYSTRDAASFFRTDSIANDVDANLFLRAARVSRERRVARKNRVESQKTRIFSILRVTIEKYFLTASGAHLRSQNDFIIVDRRAKIFAALRCAAILFFTRMP